MQLKDTGFFLRPMRALQELLRTLSDSIGQFKENQEIPKGSFKSTTLAP